MAKALLWATSGEREGKTWRGVASSIFDKSREQKDLLITYVDGKPQIDAAIADFFGEDQGSVNKQFEVDSEAVCDALSAIVREIPSSKLRVFALRQVSPGQVQVVMSRTLNPMQIISGAKLWNKGAGNLPPIVVPLPKEQGKAPEDGRPMTPYPDQIVRLLSRQWIREGAKNDKQEPFTPVAGPRLAASSICLLRTRKVREYRMRPSPAELDTGRAIAEWIGRCNTHEQKGTLRTIPVEKSIPGPDRV
jgi:hypothetical protein